jgi:hypothetical protein
MVAMAHWTMEPAAFQKQRKPPHSNSPPTDIEQWCVVLLQNIMWNDLTIATGRVSFLNPGSISSLNVIFKTHHLTGGNHEDQK